jgi:C-terminal processing protease CtpA/Prc
LILPEYIFLRTMLKKFIALFFITSHILFLQAQPGDYTRIFSIEELKEDLSFIKKEIFEVHANPWVEISKQQYEALFDSIESKITKPMNIFQFRQLIRPVLANLSDEHAAISLPKGDYNELSTPQNFPFSLYKKEGKYYVKDIAGKGQTIKKDSEVTHIDGIPVAQIVSALSTYNTGFPDQRISKAMNLIGTQYGLAFNEKNQYDITLAIGENISIKGVLAWDWDAIRREKESNSQPCLPLITYRKIGPTGYINACSFGVRGDKAYKEYEIAVDSIFDIIKKDKIESLIIDVSQNSGGNSGLGDAIIAHIFDKSYKDYQCNWKRSDQYLKLIQSWGSDNADYEKKKPGTIIHYDAALVQPPHFKNTFKGKVYILAGPSTFSSAIMFATIIKDNQIATIAGEIPTDGHPTHFGEMYSSHTPHTDLELRFGVKEWIRPSGEKENNMLIPDILIENIEHLSIEEIILQINSK